MSQKVYVAAGWKSYERARQMMRWLEERGFSISFDWTDTPEFGPDGHPHDSPRTEAQNIEYAKSDVWGVEAADILVLLGDTSPFGGLMEMGMAMRNPNKRVFAIKPEKHTIFFHLPNVRVFDSYEDFYSYVEILL